MIPMFWDFMDGVFLYEIIQQYCFTYGRQDFLFSERNTVEG